MSVKATLAAAALSLAALVPAPARAAHFDVIYGDHVDLTLCLNGCGITLAGVDFGLLVNKGLTDINGPEFFATSFTVQSSEPSITLDPFVNNPGPPVTPIHPNQAIGSTGLRGSSIFPTLLMPGETYNNTAPLQVLAFEVSRTSGSYSGPVTFTVTMKVGSEIATLNMHFDVHVGGESNITFLSAARVSSTSGPTATAVTTWGRLKSLYR